MNLKVVRFLNVFSARIFTEHLVCVKAYTGAGHIKMNNTHLFPALKKCVVLSRPVKENPD